MTTLIRVTVNLIITCHSVLPRGMGLVLRIFRSSVDMTGPRQKLTASTHKPLMRRNLQILLRGMREQGSVKSALLPL